MQVRQLALACLACLLMGACASDQKNKFQLVCGSDAGFDCSVAWNTTPTYRDACELVGQQIVEAALGETAALPRDTSTPIVVGGSPLSADESVCVFEPTSTLGEDKKAFSLVVSRRLPGSDWREYFRARMIEDKLVVQNVPGLGDFALWGFRDFGGVNYGELHVFRGRTQILIRTYDIPRSEGPLDRAKLLVVAALSHPDL